MIIYTHTFLISMSVTTLFLITGVTSTIIIEKNNNHNIIYVCMYYC